MTKRIMKGSTNCASTLKRKNTIVQEVLTLEPKVRHEKKFCEMRKKHKSSFR
jgi:hypothetical protein